MQLFPILRVVTYQNTPVEGLRIHIICIHTVPCSNQTNQTEHQPNPRKHVCGEDIRRPVKPITKVTFPFQFQDRPTRLP